MYLGIRLHPKTSTPWIPTSQPWRTLIVDSLKLNKLHKNWEWA